MVAQLMFYERVVPVSPQRHGDWYVEGGLNYEFARKANAVPLVAAEIPHAVREYTVVFMDMGDTVIPVAVLGLKDNENLYVTEGGAWDASYIPAFVRRYPFVFAKSEDGSTFTLCIDETWSGCNQEGRGERLIDEQGKRTPFLDKMMGFLKEYQSNAQRTMAYGNQLKKLGLLEPKEAQFTLASGKKASLRGFMAVSREKLKALPAETLRELAQTDELELTYAHLLSMNNLTSVLQKVAQRGSQQATTGHGRSSEESVDEPRKKKPQDTQRSAKGKPAKARKRVPSTAKAKPKTKPKAKTTKARKRARKN